MDLFFVISGFVITRLILNDTTSHNMPGLVRFWFHRARRLFPSLLLLLVCVQVWMHTVASPALQASTNNQTLAALLYVSNWQAVLSQKAYWDLQTNFTVLNHLWSLAVEEQFYLLWPLLVLGAVRILPKRTFLALTLAGAVASYLASALMAAQGNLDRAYQGTDTRAGALLLGAALAIHLSAKDFQAGDADLEMRTRRKTIALIGYVSAAVLGAVWSIAFLNDSALQFWQLPLAGIAATGLIFSVTTTRRSLLAIVLNSPALRAIGAVSYSLYLWHWPIWVFLSSQLPSVQGGSKVVLAFLGTSVVSTMSYLVLERPVHRSRIKARYLVPLLLVTGLLIALSVTVDQQPVPTERQDGILIN